MKSNLILLACFASGIAFGYSGNAPEWLQSHELPGIILTVLVIQVGISLGGNKDLIATLKQVNPKMFCLPLFTIAGTLFFTAIGGLMLHGISLRDSLAVADEDYHGRSTGSRRTGNNSPASQHHTRDDFTLRHTAHHEAMRISRTYIRGRHQLHGRMPAYNHAQHRQERTHARCSTPRHRARNKRTAPHIVLLLLKSAEERTFPRTPTHRKHIYQYLCTIMKNVKIQLSSDETLQTHKS